MFHVKKLKSEKWNQKKKKTTKCLKTFVAKHKFASKTVCEKQPAKKTLSHGPKFKVKTINVVMPLCPTVSHGHYGHYLNHLGVIPGFNHIETLNSRDGSFSACLTWLLIFKVFYNSVSLDFAQFGFIYCVVLVLRYYVM